MSNRSSVLLAVGDHYFSVELFYRKRTHTEAQSWAKESINKSSRPKGWHIGIALWAKESINKPSYPKGWHIGITLWTKESINKPSYPKGVIM